MKTAAFLVAILGCAFALPPKIDWSIIKPKTAFVKPINYDNSPLSGRVVGGTEAAPNSHPYQVALIIDATYLCGGSLISTQWVLTAAHCTISASYVQLIFGAHNIREDEPTQVVITSTNIINHSGFVSTTLVNDISVVRLPSPISLNSRIQVIAIAPASSGTFAGSTATLTGWGRVSDSVPTSSSTLQQINLSVISNAVCIQTYGSTLIVSSTICTSGAGTVGACHGDSGGPLTVNGVQIGVTSFVSATGCNSGLPSGFARVSSFRSWISQNTGI